MIFFSLTIFSKPLFHSTENNFLSFDWKILSFSYFFPLMQFASFFYTKIIMNLHHFSPQNAKIFARISPTQNHQILFHDCFHLITYLLLHSLALEWLNKLKKESRLRSPKLLKSLSPPLSTKTSPSASSPMDTDLREEEF